MKKFTSHFIPISFLVILSIFVHHAWFSNLSPITWGDWYVDYSEKLKEFFSLPLIWNSDFGLGTQNFGLSFWPFLFLSGFLSSLNLPPFLIERIIFLWPVAILLPLGMYFLSYHLLRSRIASVIGGLIFEFNTYMIILQGGHLTLLMAITLTPFFLLFFIKTLENNKFLYAVLTAFIGFAISFYEFRIFYLAVWIIFFYFIFHLVILKELKGFKDLMKKVALSITVITIILLLNLYFLLGIYSGESLASNAILNRTLFGAWYITLAKTMTIFHFGWTGGIIEPWKIQPLMARFFFIPILALLGFIVGTKNKIIPFFAFLGILGIFLAKQNTPPLPDIYQWLFDNIPGFNAFRESGKFLLYVALSYSVLLGSFVAWLWNKSKLKLNKSAKTLIVFFIAFIIVWNAKPIITGELGSLFVPRTIPNDYLILKNYLLSDNEFFRTFSSPDYSRWGHYLSSHPRTSELYLGLYEWSDFAKKSSLVDSIYFDQLLDLASIKYVIVPLRDKVNDDDFFPKTLNRGDLITHFKELPYLKRVNIGMKEVVMFENSNYRPHIYSTQKKESVYSPMPYQKIKYLKINTTEYTINLENVKDAFYLNFSENYHQSWKLRAGEFKWYKVLTEKNYFLPNKLHFKNEAGLNFFYFDPKINCSSQIVSPCQQNPDSSYNIDLTLYFKPQSYVYLGLLISTATFLICLTYFISILINKIIHII